MVYQIDDEKHVIVTDGGRVWLLDTGSPMSCARGGVIPFAGEQYEVGESIMGFVSPESLSGFVGREVDGLIGMDILRRHTVLFKTAERVLEVDEPVDLDSLQELPVRFAQAVPIVEGALEGVPHAFAFDTGAQLSYAKRSTVAALPIIDEREDFYPILGKFKTAVAEATLAFAGETFRVETGYLPEDLGFLLSHLRIDGILGRGFLNQVEVCLTAEGKFYLKRVD